MGWSRRQSFEDVFGPALAQLRALTGKLIVISEVASTEVGGNKALWIADFFAALARHPEIRGFTWFEYDKETDWRVPSSTGTLRALRAGLATQHRRTGTPAREPGPQPNYQ